MNLIMDKISRENLVQNLNLVNSRIKEAKKKKFEYKTDERPGAAQEDTHCQLCEGRCGTSYAERHHERVGETGARPTRKGRDLRVRRTREDARRPRYGYGTAGHRNQHHQLWGLRRHRRAPRWLGTHITIGQHLREGPQRCGEASPTCHGARA